MRLALALLIGAVAAYADGEKPRILFLTHSAGFTHGVVRRPDSETLAHAEKQLVAAARGKYEVHATQDCSRVTLANLANYAAVVFYTTGELPVPDKNDILEYVRAGGAFVGIHPATDTFYKFPAYGEMIGGYFNGHPWHQKVRVKVEDPNHPATKHLGESFEITDEIYQFRAWNRSKLHVLLSLDTGSVDMKKRGIRRDDGDFAVAWCKKYGKGRVFYTSLGHRPDVWNDARFLKHVVEGIGWAMEGDDGFVTIFDRDHTSGWKQAGPGGFRIEAGVATAYGGMGLWYYEKSYQDFTVQLEFQQEKISSNSGVFVRFPRVDGNPWHPVNEGYEIQIAGNAPAKNTTGSIYSFQAPTKIPLKPAGEWNAFEITCVGQKYTVKLNGELITTFTGSRSLKGMIGLQNHHDRDVVRFRNVRVKELR